MEEEFTLTKQALPNNGTILVIEDDPELLRLMEIILEREGIGYISTSSATKGLVLERNEENNIQAVITDVILPDGSGVSIARDIHDIRPQLPFLFCTGVEDPSINNLLWQHGMVYKKPIQEDFPAAVRRLIMCANADSGVFGKPCTEINNRRCVNDRRSIQRRTSDKETKTT